QPNPYVRDFLPCDFIGAGSDYLTAQCMGRAVEVAVEILIDRHLFDISAHRCTVTARHLQMPLRRHISCKMYTHCFELCETIGYGERTKFIPRIILAFEFGAPAHNRQSIVLTVILNRKVAVYSVKCDGCVSG